MLWVEIESWLSEVLQCKFVCLHILRIVMRVQWDTRWTGRYASHQLSWKMYSTNQKLTPTHSRVFLNFLHCRIIVNSSKLWNNTWNHVVTKKVLSIKIYFKFFKVPFVLTALHTLGILSTSFTWNTFPTVFKEFPHMLSTCLFFFHSAVKLIPNDLNLVEVGWLWRPGHLMQHSMTLLLGQIALTQPGGVLGHCSV